MIYKHVCSYMCVCTWRYTCTCTRQAHLGASEYVCVYPCPQQSKSGHGADLRLPLYHWQSARPHYTLLLQVDQLPVATLISAAALCPGVMRDMFHRNPYDIWIRVLFCSLKVRFSIFVEIHVWKKRLTLISHSANVAIRNDVPEIRLFRICLII